MTVTAHRHTGFTLIELLLYVMIVGSLLLAVTMFYVTTLEARAKNQTISEVNQQGELAMEYVLQTIRNADSITAPAVNATAASLTLAVPTASLSPTVFDLTGTTLQVKEGVAAAVPLTNSRVQVTTLSFSNYTLTGSPGLVRVTMVMAHVNPSNKNEYDYQRTFTSSAALRWP